MALSWHQLSPEDRALVANGCGGKGSWVPVPDWLFKASCDWHDFEYWRGGTEQDRRQADLGFYQAMRDDALRTPWWYPSRLAIIRAWLYYRAVRAWAASYFHFGPKRGLDDLAELRARRDRGELVD